MSSESVTEHKLKTWTRYWDAVNRGEKNFEVRRNDRAFQTGDIVVLEKFDPDRHAYELDGHTFSAKPRAIRKRITFLLQGGQFGIEPGYCVLGLGDPTNEQ